MYYNTVPNQMYLLFLISTDILYDSTQFGINVSARISFYFSIIELMSLLLSAVYV